eukprot:g684.t1
MKHWAQIGRVFGGSTADKNVSNNIKRAFSKWLLPYERAYYPEQAMPSSDEKFVSSNSPTKEPRKRNRRRLCSGSADTIDKKPRSSYFQSHEENNFKPKEEQMKSEGECCDLVQLRGAQQTPLSYNQSLTALPQRSYVFFPYVTEPKFYVILLSSCNEGAVGCPVASNPLLEKCSQSNGLQNDHNNNPLAEELKNETESNEAKVQALERLKPELKEWLSPIKMENCNEQYLKGDGKSETVKMTMEMTSNNNGLKSTNTKPMKKDFAKITNSTGKTRDQRSVSLNTGFCQSSIRAGKSCSDLVSFFDSPVEREKEGEKDRIRTNTL